MTKAPKSRVDQLEEEVDLLKTVIRSLSRDVAELKKAQEKSRPRRGGFLEASQSNSCFIF